MINSIKLSYTNEWMDKKAIEINNKVKLINCLIKQLDKHANSVDKAYNEVCSLRATIESLMEQETWAMSDIAKNNAELIKDLTLLQGEHMAQEQKPQRRALIIKQNKEQEQAVVEKFNMIREKLAQAKQYLENVATPGYQLQYDNYVLHLKQLYSAVREYELSRSEFLAKTGVILPEISTKDFLSSGEDKKGLPRVFVVKEYPVIEKKQKPSYVVFE